MGLYDFSDFLKKYNELYFNRFARIAAYVLS